MHLFAGLAAMGCTFAALRVGAANFDDGHGMIPPLKDRVAEQADIYALLFS